MEVMERELDKRTEDTGERKFWYALCTSFRSEKKVEERLIKRGFEVYLPMIPSVRIWSDRRKKIKLPLIPGFVFIQTSIDAVTNAIYVEGVVKIMKYLGKPAAIPETEINNLRILLKEPEFVNACEQLKIEEGEEVEVVRGPFVGLKGKYVRTQGKYRFVVEMSTLGSLIEVTVPVSFLRKSMSAV